MPFATLARVVGRTLARTIEDLLQFGEDWSWHRRYGGGEFPPRIRRAIEQARLLRTSAIDAEDYYRLGLYRRSLSFDDKAAFLGKYRNYRYYAQVNPRRYDILGHDKVLMHLLAESLRVPMPRVLATTGDPDAPGIGERLVHTEDLRTFLQQPGSEHLFFKPVSGSLGEGTLSLGERQAGRSPAWRRLPGADTVGLDAIIGHMLDDSGRVGRFLIQPRVAPHSALARILPDVLHTVRVGTYSKDGQTHILGASLRMGNGQNPTDNSVIPGGITMPIDFATGKLGEGLEVRNGLPIRRKDHPFSRQVITGTVIPHWPEILAAAQEAARQFSFIPWLAWDVGVTEDGPLITEFNTQTRWTSIQMPSDRGLLHGKLGAVLLARRGIAQSGLRYPARLVTGGVDAHAAVGAAVPAPGPGKSGGAA